MYRSLSGPVIMAICTDASRSGASVYSESMIHLLADRKDRCDPYKGLDIVIQKVQPDFVVISAVQKKLVDYMEKRFKFTILDISGKNGSNMILSTREVIGNSTTICTFNKEGEETNAIELNTMEPNFQLVIAPNFWFSMSRGIQKLINSELVESKGFPNQELKSLFITSKIEKSTDVCALRSVAAIENYITHSFAHRKLAEERLAAISGDQQVANYRPLISEVNEEPSSLMPIVDIRYIDPGPILSIDKFTLESLCIFRKSDREFLEFVPNENEIMKIPSLYDILNVCASVQGKRQLRTMMLWPLQDINELNNRHNTVEHLMRSENSLFRDQLALHLRNIVPLAPLITKLSLSIGNYYIFVALYKALWAFMAVIDLIKTNEHENLIIFDRITSLDSPALRTVVDSIMNVVDFELSKQEKRIQICSGIDQNVDEKKEIIKNLAKFCDEVAVEETAKYRHSLAKLCKVLYVPRIGFLNSVEYSSTSELLAMQTNKEFDVLLYTERSVYFKTERMEQLDKNAGDIACDLIDVQENVILNLQNDLLKHSETILRLMDLCGELDCLVAFAIVSSNRGFTRPTFTSIDEEIDIKDAYHPLYSMKNNMVPNNVKFYNRNSERQVKLMIITGPNSCGKTTYMKATCLIAYMAHIGCFVPATRARMPIVDAILTRMHSANSISTGLSSFATDVHQINHALRKATSRSIIAIDEFGKGTLASDGFHLLKGLIIYFAVRNQQSPYVMISTHFNRLVNHLSNYSERILYKTFKVSRDPARDTISYEFQLMDGVGDISLADKVATLAGVPQTIIERAQQIRDYITANRQIRPVPPRGA